MNLSRLPGTPIESFRSERPREQNCCCPRQFVIPPRVARWRPGLELKEFRFALIVPVQQCDQSNFPGAPSAAFPSASPDRLQPDSEGWRHPSAYFQFRRARERTAPGQILKKALSVLPGCRFALMQNQLVLDRPKPSDAEDSADA